MVPLPVEALALTEPGSGEDKRTMVWDAAAERQHVRRILDMMKQSRLQEVRS
jgi:hypothetical protein